MISVKICAEYGATSDGLSTIVQPVANAGNTLQAIWLIGQFHGVIRPQTPIGSLTHQRGAVLLLELEVLQHFDGRLQVTDAEATWGPPPSEAGAPISSVTASARSPARFWYSARIACSSVEALLAAGLRPGGERLAGRRDGLVDVGGGAERDRAGDLLRWPG